MAVAAGAFLLYAVMPTPANIAEAIDKLRAAAVAMGCPADRVRVSARVEFPKTEVEITCAPEAPK